MNEYKKEIQFQIKSLFQTQVKDNKIKLSNREMKN